MLKNKTRILITHDIDILDKVDRVIVMKQGRIIHQGHFEELKHLEYFRVILEKGGEEVKGKSFTRKSYGKDILNHNKNILDNISKSCNNDIVHRRYTLNDDENKEEIKVNLRSFINLFLFNYWTLFVIVLVIICLFSQKQLNVKFHYYLIHWVKEISKHKENDHDMFK